MRNKRFWLLVFLALGALVFQSVAAQAETPLTISLSKDFGYNDFSGRIQGAFSVRAAGPADLARVIFLIDGQTMAEVTQPPFRHSFNTSSYPDGVHSFTAQGFTSGGQELTSNEVRKQFISGEQSRSSLTKIILPIVVLLGSVFLFMALFSIRGGGKKLQHLPPGAPRSYGALGGTICPKCGRPFGMHAWGLNMLVGKLDRCPYCGKWSLVSHQSPQALHQAEQAELVADQDAGQFEAPSDDERLRKELDDSRYQDG